MLQVELPGLGVVELPDSIGLAHQTGAAEGQGLDLGADDRRHRCGVVAGIGLGPGQRQHALGILRIGIEAGLGQVGTAFFDRLQLLLGIALALENGDLLLAAVLQPCFHLGAFGEVVFDRLLLFVQPGQHPLLGQAEVGRFDLDAQGPLLDVEALLLQGAGAAQVGGAVGG